MKRNFCVYTLLSFALVLSTAIRAMGESEIVARFLGANVAAPETEMPHPLATTAKPTPGVMVFSAAQVGVAAGSAQKLTASFAVSGYTGSLTPTAALHYGHDYSLGAVNCSPATSGETCTVAVTFVPTLPGGRPDALLLMNGSTTLSTVLLGGVGQAPMALVQPGVITSPLANEAFYIYQSVVDENGTVYFLSASKDAVYSYTKDGTLNELPIIGLTSPHAIAIDGAGTLYIAQNTYGKKIATYSAAGLQSSTTVDPPLPYTPCSNSGSGAYDNLISVAVDGVGDLFALEAACDEVFELKADGTYATTAVNPAISGPAEIAVDSSGDVFIGGGEINEIAAGGTQTQVTTSPASYGVPSDAAGTIYATGYTGGYGVAELGSADYTTPILKLDPNASALGASVGAEGTVWVGNYGSLDKVDRSQGAIAFGAQQVNNETNFQTVGIYNGGNEDLNISNIAETGAAFTMVPASISPCSNGIDLAAGESCQMAVSMTAPRAGSFTGQISFTSDSLNTPSTVRTVALSGFAYGVYMIANPATVSFNNQAGGTTSGAKTVMLTNQGYDESAYIYTPTSSDPAFTPTLGSCTTAIAVGADCQLSVTFTPSQAKLYSATITVPVASTGGQTTPSVTFTVTGMGVTTATLGPSALSFPITGVGEASAAKTLVLKNTGSASMGIPEGGIAIKGAGAASFKVASKCSSTLAAGSSCNLMVSFKPTALGPLSAVLQVTDGAASSPQKVTLSGTGAALAMLSPVDLTFPETAAGSASAVQIAKLRNPGTVPLKISSGGVVIAGADASSFAKTTTCGSTLAAGATCEISIRFQPKAAGKLSATLIITDDAAATPQRVALSGVGAASASLLPGTLAFPSTQVNASSAPLTAKLKNTSTAQLKIATGGIMITGANANSFTKTTTCGSTLAAGATCNISVVFKPKATGASTAYLQVTDNALGSPQKVKLTGTGD